MKKHNPFDLRNPKVRAGLAIVVCTLGGAWAIWQFKIEPMQARLDKLKREHERLQQELLKIHAMRPRLAELREQLASDSLRLDSLRSMFPDQKEIPRLIREITRVARASGINTTIFSPQPDSVREYYVENNYEMAIIGGYHELAEFFSFLANLPLIINIRDVVIEMNPEIEQSIGHVENRGGNVQSIVARFGMTTFSSRN